MKGMMFAGAASALALTLSACGSNEEAVEKNTAASDMNTMMAGSGPFADAEMKMDRAMMAAVGVNAADSWVRKMIEHHRGAIEMSRIVLTKSPTAEVVQMARMTIDKQGKEVTDLEKLVATGNPDPASAELFRPAEMRMHDAMMSTTGSNISETYLRKMLAHHQGAIAMSDVALANGAIGRIRAKIEMTKADQQKEAAMVEAMLRGVPHAQDGGGSATRVASDRKESPSASKGMPVPGTKTPEHVVEDKNEMEMHGMNHNV